jgi:hypothetical protein
LLGFPLKNLVKIPKISLFFIIILKKIVVVIEEQGGQSGVGVEDQSGG